AFKSSPTVRVSSAAVRYGVQSTPVKPREVPWPLIEVAPHSRSGPIARRQNAPQAGALQGAGLSFPGVGNSRKRVRTDGRHRKQASRQRAYRTKRNDQSAAASRPTAPSRTRSNSAEESNRRFVQLRGLPAGSN